MIAEIICVGTELLLGEIVNSNAAYLARELAAIGVSVYHQSVVGDNPARLRAALEVALARADLVLTTGGLGPTADDLTKEVVAETLDRPLALHEPTLQRIEQMFARTGRQMTANNRKQAMLPEGAIVLPNQRGTAAGVLLESAAGTVVLLPGPPRELEPMFAQEVLPYLTQRSQEVLVSHTLHFFGIGESALESVLPEALLAGANPTAALYAAEGEVRLRITARAAAFADAERASAAAVAEVRQHLTHGDQTVAQAASRSLYGVDVGSLEAALVAELTASHLTIAVAESCTGGLVTARLTAIPGSSQVFGFGLCTYADVAKVRLLGVRDETLARHGAVSAETAAEMAAGARALAASDLAVATTGIAGPTGATEHKPVGLVYVGIATPTGTQTECWRLSRGYARERNFIRQLAASHALFRALRTAEGMRPRVAAR